MSENPGGGRGFGCTGGHFHWNWAQDDFRKTVLNAIAWIAKEEVPENGVQSTRPTVDDLLANQDEPVPAHFDKEKQQKELDAMNAPPPAPPAAQTRGGREVVASSMPRVGANRTRRRDLSTGSSR